MTLRATVLATLRQGPHFLPVDRLVIVGNRAYNCCVVYKLDACVGGVHGPAVVGEQRVQEWAEHAPLLGLCVEDQQSGDVVSYLHHLGVSRQEVQDSNAQGRVQTQGPEIDDELGGYYGVEG